MQKFNQFKPKKHTLDIPSMPQNEKEYTYFGKIFSKFHKKITQKRLFKPLAAGTLALFMGIGTLCGVLIAPANTAAQMQASKEAASATQASSATNAETYGLVTPCEDDPVVYKTDYGLEIKFGAALTSGTSLGSGNLAGFPYITSGGYTWVIIGRSTTMTSLLHQKLSQYQTDKSYFTNFTYLFNNIYETTSPAGAAIKNDNVLNDYCASPISTANISFANIINSSIKSNAEIPANCVLVLANSHVATGRYKDDYDYQTNSTNWYYSNAFLSGRYGNQTFRTGIYTAMKGYYDNSSYGISSFKNKIKAISLTTSCYTDIHDQVYGTISNSDLYIFPLAGNSSDTFYYGRYLTAAQSKLSVVQSLRGGPSGRMSIDIKYDLGAGFLLTSAAFGSAIYNHDDGIFSKHYCLNTSGSLTSDYVGLNKAFRPAFVLSLV